MTLEGWRADTLNLVAREGSRARRTAAALALAITVGTGIAYALPFNQRIDDTVSNTTFTALALMVTIVAAARAQNAAGLNRLAWSLVSLSFVVTVVLFAADPPVEGSGLSLALQFAVITSFGFWGAVIALSAPALPGLASLRTAADALWVTTSLVIALWPWVTNPLLHIAGPSSFERALHVSFAISTIALSTTTLVVIPHTAGRGRVALWFLGVGGAIASVAGVFHIRFFYEGTLRFGSWWDYLWTIGLAALLLGALTAVDNELVPRRRPVIFHAVITVLPLAFAATAIMTAKPGTGHLVGAIVLLAVLALRVVALLAENDRLNRSLSDEARIDPLTSLGNRRALEAGIDLLGDEAESQDRYRAVVLVDLDRFKLVNDTHGHLVGDEVLKIVARRLRDAVRDRDILVRQGGDEFIAVMVVRDEPEARRAATRLGDAVKGSYSLAVGAVSIGATMGVAIDDGRSKLDDILAVADDALYAAKAGGRGSIVLQRCRQLGPAELTPDNVIRMNPGSSG